MSSFSQGNPWRTSAVSMTAITSGASHALPAGGAALPAAGPAARMATAALWAAKAAQRGRRGLCCAGGSLRCWLGFGDAGLGGAAERRVRAAARGSTALLLPASPLRPCDERCIQTGPNRWPHNSRLSSPPSRRWACAPSPLQPPAHLPPACHLSFLNSEVPHQPPFCTDLRTPQPPRDKLNPSDVSGI